MNNNINNELNTNTEDLVSNRVMNKLELGGVCGTYTAAVRDDYEYWRVCGESDTSGKLFLIDYKSNNGNNNCDIIGDSSYDNNDINNATYNDNERNHNHQIDSYDNDVNNVTNKKNKIFDIENNNDKNNINSNEGQNNSISNTGNKSELPSNNNNNNTKKTIQLFFDDNIERDRLHIVDVRDLRTLIPVPFNKVNNIFVKKVEPYFAIIDDNYFINEALNMINAQIKL